MSNPSGFGKGDPLLGKISYFEDECNSDYIEEFVAL